MKREEYMAELKLKLEENDFGPVEEAIAYFNELLDDRMADEGLGEEAAVASLEAPAQAAAQLKESESAAREKPSQSAQEADDFVPGIRTINAKAQLVRRILVRDRNTLLTVIGEEREDILIRHPETRKARYLFTLKDGTLSLIREENQINFQLFVWDAERLPREMREVELRVPSDLAAELDLRTSNAKLSLEDIACWGQVEAGTSNAKLSATDMSAKSLRLKTSNAGLALERVSAQQALQAVTSNGKISAEELSAPILTLTTSNGGIALEDISSEHITLTTSNGAIKGELPGSAQDYAISSRTSNGKNSLPSSSAGGPKRLSAHTSNAGINLRFAGGGTPEKPSASPDPDGRVSQAIDQVEDRLSHLGDRLAQGIEDSITRAFGGGKQDKGRD